MLPLDRTWTVHKTDSLDHCFLCTPLQEVSLSCLSLSRSNLFSLIGKDLSPLLAYRSKLSCQYLVKFSGSQRNHPPPKEPKRIRGTVQCQVVSLEECNSILPSCSLFLPLVQINGNMIYSKKLWSHWYDVIISMDSNIVEIAFCSSWVGIAVE
jgi:hypothetical protein